MATNRGVAYIKPGEVAIQSIPYPKLRMPKSETDPFGGKEAPHGVILKIVTTNICGSDQHMVRGRTTAPQGLILGHEITGEIIEKGNDVEMLNVGDLVTVPFNIACGRCRNCREGKTGICLTVNPARPGAAYGYVDMGGWVGGQAEYVLVPYADFYLIKFPNKEKAMAKIKDPTAVVRHLPDRLSTAVSQAGRWTRALYGLHRGRGSGGSGRCGGSPVAGRGCGHRRRHDSGTLGAGQELRMRSGRPPQRCHAGPADRADPGRAAGRLRGGLRGLRSARPGQGCRGGTSRNGAELPPGVGPRGRFDRYPGSVQPDRHDPGGVDENAKIGALSIRIGLGWAKSCSFHTGQCPVLRYNRQLMMAILHDKVHPAKAVNATIISLDDRPAGLQRTSRQGRVPRSSSSIRQRKSVKA